tara:strand:+ start:174 stop:566 length:393 start_codon:yes stop_codon:yes gene_type:complete
LAIQQSFDEIQLADRKERVKAMQDSYDKIPDIRVALKLKILAQIRAEVGQDQPIQHVHAVHVGVNIPPRAETYEEWLDQNQLVVHEAKSKAADLSRQSSQYIRPPSSEFCDSYANGKILAEERRGERIYR